MTCNNVLKQCDTGGKQISDVSVMRDPQFEKFQVPLLEWEHTDDRYMGSRLRQCEGEFPGLEASSNHLLS